MYVSPDFTVGMKGLNYDLMKTVHVLQPIEQRSYHGRDIALLYLNLHRTLLR
jgi:hypothetical protein